MCVPERLVDFLLSDVFVGIQLEDTTIVSEVVRCARMIMLAVVLEVRYIDVITINDGVNLVYNRFDNALVAELFPCYGHSLVLSSLVGDVLQTRLHVQI